MSHLRFLGWLLREGHPLRHLYALHRVTGWPWRRCLRYYLRTHWGLWRFLDRYEEDR